MRLINRFLPIPLIALLAMGIYVNTLKNGFVYDDKDTIVNNMFIKELNNLPKLFEKDYFKLSGETSYRPVVTFTYFFEYALFGLKPWGYHLTNILLHAFNVVLLYIFVQLLTEGSDRAKVAPLLTSFLFAAHPVLTEAVNAISFREDLLVFLFYITTLNLFLISRQGSKPGRSPFWTVMLYLASCVTFFIALLSKEMAVTLPLIIYWYEWIYCDKKKGLHKILFNRYNIGYIAITVFYLYLRFYYFHNPLERDSLGWEVTDRLLTVPWLILNSLKLTIFPISLSVDYLIMPVKDAASLLFLLPSIAIISLIGMTFLIEKKEKCITFGIGFFLITLIPVYNIIPITNPLAIRYLYMPAVGFCIVMGLNFCLLYEAFISRPKTRQLYLFIPFIAIMVIYSSGVINRNKAWKDNYSLWSDAARKVPQNIRPYYNDLGNILYEQGRFEDAIKQYQIAIRVRPDFVEAYNNLGNVLAEMGRFEEAVVQYRTTLKFRPDITDVRVNLANLYLTMGKFDDAILEFKTAAKLKPDDPQLHYLIGIAYNKQGQFKEAVQELRNAIRLQPDNPAFHNDLAVFYADKNYLDEAAGEYQQVLRLNPASIKAHYDLGMIYLRMRLKDKARKEFEIILKMEPDFLPARQALETLDGKR